MPSGNANYINAFAYSVAKELDHRWTHIWIIAWPLYSMIKGNKLSFNNAAKDTTGTKMLIPNVFQNLATSARPATNANQFTAITPTPTQGATQLEFLYATYENATWLNIQEYAQLIGSTNMMSVLSMKVPQLMFDFTNVINTDMIGTQNAGGRDGNGQVMGEQYWLSATNSPGNMSQSSTTAWQAGINSSGGSFNENLITNEYDRIKALGRGAPDACQLSYASGNNVYNKLRQLIGTAQIITNPESPAKYGFTTFRAYELECWQDGPLGTALPGSMAILSTDSIWLNQDSDKPIPARENSHMRLEGTSTEEWMYTYTLAVGVSDCARNSLVTGIT